MDLTGVIISYVVGADRSRRSVLSTAISSERRTGTRDLSASAAFEPRG